MKEKFEKWNIGGKLIAISSIVAIISLFMSWVDLGILRASGFQQQGYIFLVFYIYPVFTLLKEKPINKIGGIISSLLAVILTFMFMLSKSVDVFGETVNGAGVGIYLFILASIGLVIGVVKYEAEEEIKY